MKDINTTKILQYISSSNCTVKQFPVSVCFTSVIYIECSCGNTFNRSPKQINRYKNTKKPLNCGCLYKKWTNEKIDDNIKTRTIIRKSNCNIKGFQPSTSHVIWECKVCLLQWNSRVDSVIKKKSGCPHCVGNFPYTVDSLNLKLKSLQRTDLIVKTLYVGDIDNSRTADFKCIKCEDVWNANIHNVIKFRYGCPKCNNNIGTFVNVDGITFHSKLEYYFWLTYNQYHIKHAIVRQQKYLPTRRLTCDFYLPELQTWVEITGGVLLRRPSYAKTLQEKRNIITQKNETFVQLQSFAEINKFIKSIFLD